MFHLCGKMYDKCIPESSKSHTWILLACLSKWYCTLLNLTELGEFSGFSKKLVLSPLLAELVGHERVSISLCCLNKQECSLRYY